MSRRLLLSLWLSVVLIAGAALAQARLSARDVQHLKNAVVMIEVTLDLGGGDESRAIGSGFVISEEGQIVTNAHVVSMLSEGMGETVRAVGREVQVIFHSGTGREETYPAEVLRENHDLNLALIKVDLPTPFYLQLGDSDAVTETSTIYACGHPLGLREISLRTGTVTAHRTWEGHQYIEHDAIAEGGNSGGPVVDSDLHVIGVHTLTLAASNMMTKFAIPSNVIRDWLATDPSEDPPPPDPGANVRDLLDAAELTYKEETEGIFTLPFDNEMTVEAHQYEDFLRVYVPLGELPGGENTEQGNSARQALTLNFSDPLGRMSIWDDEGTYRLYWEAQMPTSAARSGYLKLLTQAGAQQAANWWHLQAGEALTEVTSLYPGGDDEALLAQLKEIITVADLTYEEEDGCFSLPYDNEITVHADSFRGMAWIYCWTGGMPGAEEAEPGQQAINILKRNWDDSFGRLSLDEDNDVLWEALVPFDFLTPEYFSTLAATCATQVADYWETFGHVPFNGE